LPPFFLVLESDGKNAAQRGFLVHIGEEHISGTLKRLREMDPSEGADLHKKSRQFNYGEEDELSSPDGEGLLEAIENQVGPLEDYISWKQESLRTVGYDGEKWKLNLVIPPPPTGIDAEEYLLDFALGLIPSIEVKNLEIRDVRFGIPSEEPTTVLPEALIEIQKRAVGTGTLILAMPQEGRQLRLETEVYMPHGVPLPTERQHFKARLAAPFIDLVAWPFTEGKADLQHELPDPYTEYDLAQMQPVSDLVLMLHDAQVQDSTIDIEARALSKRLFYGHINVRGAFSKQELDYVSATRYAWAICKHFDVAHLARARPGELLEQLGRLELMASVLGPGQPTFAIVHSSTGSLADTDGPLCVPYATDAVIGQYRMAIAIAILVEPVLLTGADGDDHDLQTQTNDVRLHRCYLGGRDEASKDYLEELGRSVIKDYEENFQILIVNGVNDHLI
jgi:hypothetical protein